MSPPYRITPIFNAQTLPSALTVEHRTKPRVWGIVRVLEGKLRYRVLLPPSELEISPACPGLIVPEQPHCLVVLGRPNESFRLQVEFYDHAPEPEDITPPRGASAS